MAYEITISSGDLVMEAALNDTTIANKLKGILPITTTTNTWGEEIYFTIPLEEILENPQEIVNEGDLGYWPPGHAFCIFFGVTPASRGTAIRAASAVTVIGKVLGDATRLKEIQRGQAITITLIGQ